MQRIARRRYTDDFKAQAVALAESIGPAKAARQLDMSGKTLANWLGASRGGQPLSSPSRKPVSETVVVCFLEDESPSKNLTQGKLRTR